MIPIETNFQGLKHKRKRKPISSREHVCDPKQRRQVGCKCPFLNEIYPGRIVQQVVPKQDRKMQKHEECSWGNAQEEGEEKEKHQDRPFYLIKPGRIIQTTPQPNFNRYLLSFTHTVHLAAHDPTCCQIARSLLPHLFNLRIVHIELGTRYEDGQTCLFPRLCPFPRHMTVNLDHLIFHRVSPHAQERLVHAPQIDWAQPNTLTLILESDVIVGMFAYGKDIIRVLSSNINRLYAQAGLVRLILEDEITIGGLSDEYEGNELKQLSRFLIGATRRRRRYEIYGLRGERQKKGDPKTWETFDVVGTVEPQIRAERGKKDGGKRTCWSFSPWK